MQQGIRRSKLISLTSCQSSSWLLPTCSLVAPSGLCQLELLGRALASCLWPVNCKLDQTSAFGVKKLDLGSLSAGGATWLLHTTENSELVRRHGRWLNHKVMEIYIQEVSAVLLLPRLPREARDTICHRLVLFQPLLTAGQKRRQLGLPDSSWFQNTLSGLLL